MDEEKQVKSEPVATETPVAADPPSPAVAAPAAPEAVPKKRYGKVIAWVVAAFIVIGGGTYAALALLGGSDSDPEQAVVSYVAKLPDIQSGEIDFTITYSDEANLEEPLILTGSAVMNAEGAGITASLNLLPLSVDLRMFSDALYAKINGIASTLAAFPDYAALGESFSELEGAWLGLELSDLASMGMTQESVSNLPALSDAETTALMDLMAEHPPFNVVETADTKQVGDLQLTKKYEITFDAVEAKAFIAGIRDLDLEALRGYDLDYDEALEAIDGIDDSMAEAGVNDLSLTVWADDENIRHIELVIGAEESSFEIVATVTSINEPVTIEVPTVDYFLNDLLNQLTGGISPDSMMGDY